MTAISTRCRHTDRCHQATNLPARPAPPVARAHFPRTARVREVRKPGGGVSVHRRYHVLESWGWEPPPPLAVRGDIPSTQSSPNGFACGCSAVSTLSKVIKKTCLYPRRSCKLPGLPPPEGEDCTRRTQLRIFARILSCPSRCVLRALPSPRWDSTSVKSTARAWETRFSLPDGRIIQNVSNTKPMMLEPC